MVCLGSIDGMSGATPHHAYSVMKAALALDEERGRPHGPRASANAVRPASSRAAVGSRSPRRPRGVPAHVARIPGRRGHPKKWRCTLPRLPRASWVSGATVLVDGGEHPWWADPRVVALATVAALAWGSRGLLMLRGSRRLRPLGLARWLMVFGTVMILPIAPHRVPSPRSGDRRGGLLRARGHPRVLPGTEHRSAHDRVADRRDERGVRRPRRDRPPGRAVLAARHGGLASASSGWWSRPTSAAVDEPKGSHGRARRRAPGRVHRRVGRLERTDRPRVVGGRLPPHRAAVLWAAAPFSRAPLGLPRADLGLVLRAAAIETVGFAAFTTALDLGPVAVVAVIAAQFHRRRGARRRRAARTTPSASVGRRGDDDRLHDAAGGAAVIGRRFSRASGHARQASRSTTTTSSGAAAGTRDSGVTGPSSARWTISRLSVPETSSTTRRAASSGRDQRGAGNGQPVTIGRVRREAGFDSRTASCARTGPTGFVEAEVTVGSEAEHGEIESTAAATAS